MTAVPSNADTQQAGFKLFANPPPMSPFVCVRIGLKASVALSAVWVENRPSRNSNLRQQTLQQRTRMRGFSRPNSLVKMSSRPEDFHLQALPEPCMTLSSHTAPDVRPFP